MLEDPWSLLLRLPLDLLPLKKTTLSNLPLFTCGSLELSSRHSLKGCFLPALSIPENENIDNIQTVNNLFPLGLFCSVTNSVANLQYQPLKTILSPPYFGGGRSIQNACYAVVFKC